MKAFFRRSADGEPTMHAGDEKPDDQVSLLEATVAGMQQDMQEKDRQIERLEAVVAQMEQDMAGMPPPSAGAYARDASLEQAAMIEQQAIAEARIAELQAASGEKDQQIVRLEEALAATEESLFQRASDAEARAEFLQACANEKDNRIAQLEDAMASMGQHQPDVEMHIKRAMDAETRVAQVQATADEKEQYIVRLEAEIALLRTAATGSADTKAHSQRAADAEAKASQLQVLVDAKDKQIMQLETILQGMEEEHSQLQASAAQDERVPQLEAMLQQREFEVSQLQSEMERAAQQIERVETEKMEILQDSVSSREELLQLQATLNGKDADLTQLLESERNTSAAQKQAAEAEISHLQKLVGERDQLIARLQSAVAAAPTGASSAEVAQLTRSFEEEKLTLQNELTAQFEAEYAALHSQVATLQKEAEAARSERDTTASELQRVVTQYEQRQQASTSQAAILNSSEVAAKAQQEADRQEQASKVSGSTRNAAVMPAGGLAAQSGAGWHEGPGVLPKREVTGTSPRGLYRSSYVAAAPIHQAGAAQRAASPIAAATVQLPLAHMQVAKAPAQVASPLRGSIPFKAPAPAVHTTGAVSPISPLRGYPQQATQPVFQGATSPNGGTASPLRLQQATANMTASPLRMRPPDPAAAAVFKMVSPVAFKQVASPVASPLRLRPNETMPVSGTSVHRVASPPMTMRSQWVARGSVGMQPPVENGSKYLLSEGLVARSPSGSAVLPVTMAKVLSPTGTRVGSDLAQSTIFSQWSDMNMVDGA
mmetsp:Transcript_146975/g.409406  ORF Transcript_146975/g.409406 Transcript_146975/m.409406 type:complete len:773 (+) Transcript_146975:61-2379(+)